MSTQSLPTSENAWVQINFRVPNKMAQQLKDQSDKEDRTQSAILRRALCEYLQKQTREESAG